MLILESHDLCLVLIHTPKTAGTTLRNLIINGIRKKYKQVDIKRIERLPQDHSGSSSVLLNSNKNKSSNLPPVGCKQPILGNNSNIIVPTKKDSVLTICYGYWHICNNVDLAHIPRRHVHKFYPPDRSYIIDKKKFYWVSCVRNPYSRIYSAYAWFMKENHLTLDCKQFNKFVIHQLPKIIADYCEQFMKGEIPHYRYIHFMPMWMMLAEDDGKPYYDFIVRQETFATDVCCLMEGLKIPLNRESIMNGREYKHRTTGGKVYYDHLQHYTSEAINIIEKLYGRDFIMFGYKFILNDM